MTEMLASAFGSVNRNDLQIIVPVRPLVRRGIQVRPVSEGAVVDGALVTRKFRGDFAKNQLPLMIDLLDGAHSHEEIAAELGLMQEQAYSALALLWTSGVIEDAEHDTGSTAPDALSNYLSRMADATANEAHWTRSLDRLQSVRIALQGGTLADDVARLLAADGVDVCPPDQLRVQSSDLVVHVCADPEDPQLLMTANAAWASSTRLLPVLLQGSVLSVGPLIDRNFSACLRCAINHDAVNPAASGVEAGVAAGVIAREVMAIGAGIGSSALPLDRTRIDLASFQTRFLPAVTRPGCRWCSVADQEVDGSCYLAAQYEAAVAAPPREFLAVKGHQAHYQQKNIDLQAQFKSWPDAERIPLPEVSPGDLQAEACRGPAIGDGAIDVDALACLLQGAVGLQEPLTGQGKTKRWTAMGGNIGAVTAYASVHDVANLDDGWYVYDNLTHALIRIGDLGPAGREQPSVALYLIGDVDKVARKYGAFALRVVLQDAACALVTAGHVLSALGLGWTPLLNWPEEAIRNEVGLPGTREMVCSALALRRERA
ncbi:hypothetical protein J5X07_08050 [Actinomyces bowdenii]|uniref:SagB/ThcOx family dehydrogenase n=1 Tax=Actinomyces bowdenii TaxID=131109 RepID=A0A3P1V650_9ACTO|nr:hypothetical protein [Actinomyces bowdenii]MBO3724977.1 hypothetical protein [Actinomyces bowdenii]RRD28950.1 hypothetical protein EII10_08315 [Actinomyces bowdenii]